MNGFDAIRTSLKSTQHLTTWFLSDLSDADLLVRPVPGANHIAWQMGHVTSSEARTLAQVPGAMVPELPPGFAEQHGKATQDAEPPKGFLTRDQYVEQFNKVRQATLDALDKLSEADLDKPTSGPIARFASTLGALFLLASNHSMMHSGQFSVVRRKLGKPVLF